MSLYAFDAVEDAISATRGFLFPFDLSRWLKLALLMFFIGGGGGGSTPTQFSNTGGGSVPDPTGGGTGGMPSFPSIGPTEWAIIGAVVATLILLALAFALVAAVFEFVFVESLRSDRVAIREYWSEYRNRGIRLFGFRLVTGLAVLLFVLGGLGLALWPLVVGSGELSVGLLLLVLPVILVLAIINGFLQGFTTQFVVPIMLLEDRGVIAGWKRFWPTLTGEWKEYVGYVVMRFVLQIAVGILLGIIVLIAGIIIAIPLGVLGIAGFALVEAQPVLGWVIVSVAALLFLVAALLVSLFGAVPVQTFLRYYALLVLGETNEVFDAIPSQRAAAQE